MFGSDFETFDWPHIGRYFSSHAAAVLKVYIEVRIQTINLVRCDEKTFELSSSPAYFPKGLIHQLSSGIYA